MVAGLFAWLKGLFTPHPGPGGWRLYHWRNWAGNRSCTANTYFEPRTKEDIQQIVRDAREKGVQIRVVGNSYSWSRLIPTDEFLVCLKRMNALVDIDTHDHTVTVECGMSLGTLTDWLTRTGMAVHSPTVIPFLSVGGIVAIGAHGSSTVDGPFPDQVLVVSYVTADGELSEVTAKDERQMRAFRASLGALGIVYQVKLQCVENFRIHVRNYLEPLENALEQLPQLVKDHEYVDMFLFPYTDQAWMKIGDRTDAPVNVTLWQKIKKFFGVVVIEKIMGGPGLWLLCHLDPKLAPAFLNLSMKINPELTLDWVVESQKALHYETGYPKCVDFSYAVDHVDAVRLWRHYLAKLDEYREQGKYPVNMIVHSRFIRETDTYLSPAVGREMTAYVEMVTSKYTPGWKEFFEDVETGVLDGFENPRPHWGKIYSRARRIKGNYGKHAAEFEEIRRSLDREGVFLNSFLRDEVFQLPSDEGSGPA